MLYNNIHDDVFCNFFTLFNHNVVFLLSFVTFMCLGSDIGDIGVADICFTSKEKKKNMSIQLLR